MCELVDIYIHVFLNSALVEIIVQFHATAALPFGKEAPVQLGYLDVTVLQRGVGEIRVLVGRAPACWQRWRDVCSHWKQTND
jgi:hypothetical protein